MRLDYFILIASKLHEDIPVRHTIVKRALKGEILQSRAKIQVLFLRDKILFLDKFYIFKPTCIVPFYYIDDFNTRIFWKLEYSLESIGNCQRSISIFPFITSLRTSSEIVQQCQNVLTIFEMPEKFLEICIMPPPPLYISSLTLRAEISHIRRHEGRGEMRDLCSQGNPH